MPWSYLQLICAAIVLHNTNAQFTHGGTGFSCKKKVDGDYPFSADSCRTDFVTCSNSITYRQICPTGLYYDPDNRICDRKHLITPCGGSPDDGGTDATTQGTTVDFDCPSSDGAFPHPTLLCTPVYFMCSANRPQQKQCAAGELFDAASESCQPQVAVGGCAFDCSNRPNGMYAMGCSQMFWWCWNSVASKHSCVTGLYFDEPYGECTYKQWVEGCGGKRPETTPADDISTRSTTTASSVEFDCSSVSDGDYGLKPDMCDKQYVTCSNGNAILRNCPPGLYFDAENGRCDRESSISVCGGSDTNECTGREDGDYALGVCLREYFACWNGHVEERTCPRGMFFNSQTRYCDRRNMIPECENDPTPTPPPTGPCVNQPDHTKIQIKPCNPTFIECVGGSAIIMTCPDGQVYSDEYGCNPIEWIPECSPSPTPTHPTPTVTVSNPTSAPECNEGEKYAIGDCERKYIVCSGGQRVPARCPPGDVFFAALQECVMANVVPGCYVSTTKSTTQTTTASTTPSTTTQSSSCTEGEKLPIGVCQEEYVECKDGRPQRQWCGSGQVFYAPLKDCLPEATVPGCRPTQTTPRPTDTTRTFTQSTTRDTPTTPFCEDGATKPTGVCSDKYIVCVNGDYQAAWCPGQQVYYAALASCVPVNIVPGCYVTPTNTPTQTTPTRTTPSTTVTTPSTTATTTQGTPGECVAYERLPLGPCEEVFIQCFKGVPVQTWCPPGQVFDASVLRCVAQSSCGTTTTSTTTTTQASPICPSFAYSKIPSGVCQEEFIICMKGVPSAKWCPPQTVFSSSSLNCQPPANVPECNVQTSPPKCVENSRVPVGVCSEEYLLCVNGDFVRKWCGPGHVFSQSTSFCLPIASVPECAPQTNPPVVICVDGAKLPKGACDEEYFLCVNNEWVAQWCGLGTIFCPTGMKCVNKIGSVHCAPVTTTTQSTPVCVEGTKTPISTCQEEFLYCFGGSFIKKWCPPGLYFSALNGNCQPVCDGVFTTTTQATPTCVDNEKIPTGACEEEFWYCFNGQPLRKWCPRGLYFSPINGNCQPVCDGATTTTTQSTPVCVGNAKIPTGACEEEFWYCINGQPLRKWCPRGLYFSPINGNCQPVCDGATTTTTQSTPVCVGNEKIPTGACEEEFWYCFNGQPLRKWCPRGLYFSPINGNCQKVCDGAVTTTQGTHVCVGNEKIPTGACEEEFWYCFNGQPLRKWCPRGLYFSPINGNCQKVCDGAATTTQGTPVCVGNEKIATGPCEEEFWYCFKGTPLRKWCPQGRFFNEATGKCEKPWYPECDGTSPTTTEAAPVCENNEKIATGDCEEEYIKCWRGRPVFKWCGAGKKFSQSLQRCKKEDKVPECQADAACEDGDKRAVDECSEEYEKCVDGEWVAQWCGRKLVFSADHNRCKPQHKVDQCTPPTTEMTPGSCTHGDKAATGDCESQFTICVGGWPKTMSCPKWFKFDPETLRCRKEGSIDGCSEQDDDEEEFDADTWLNDGEEWMRTENLDLDEIPDSICEGAGKTKKSLGPCHKYFVKCWDDRYKLEKCPNGRKWDQVEKKCRKKEDIEGCRNDNIYVIPEDATYESICGSGADEEEDGTFKEVYECSPLYVRCNKESQTLSKVWCPVPWLQFDEDEGDDGQCTIKEECLASKLADDDDQDAAEDDDPNASTGIDCSDKESEGPFVAMPCMPVYFTCELINMDVPADGWQVDEIKVCHDPWAVYNEVKDKCALDDMCENDDRFMLDLTTGSKKPKPWSTPESEDPWDDDDLWEEDWRRSKRSSGWGKKSWRRRQRPCKGKDNGVMLPGEEPCSESVYICVDGKPLKKRCPMEDNMQTVYAPAFMDCVPMSWGCDQLEEDDEEEDWYYEGDEDAEEDDVGYVKSSARTADNTCEGKDDGYEHELGQCSNVYCRCEDEEPVFLTCGWGEVFVECDAGTDSADCGCVDEDQCTVESSPEELCTDVDGWRNKVATGDCEADYVHCKDSGPVEKSCTKDGYVFVQSAQKCKPRSSVDGCMETADQVCEGKTGIVSGEACTRIYYDCGEEDDDTDDNEEKECPKKNSDKELLVFDVDSEEDPPCSPKDDVAACVETDPKCEGADDELVAKNSCSRKYYDCEDPTDAQTIYCDRGEVFVEAMQLCEEKEWVPECDPDFEEDSELCEDADEDTPLLATGTCERKYYNCEDPSKPWPKSCKFGFVFVESEQECQDKDWVSDCDEQSVDYDDLCQWRDESGLSKFALGPCSRDYIECVGDTARARWCPRGEVFEQDWQTCVPKDECVESAPGSTPSPDPCLDEPTGTKLPTEDCTDEYIYCYRGVSRRRWCSGNTVFEAAWSRCVPPAVCRPTVTTTTEATPTDPTCSWSPDGTKHALGSCSPDYCVCKGGMSVFYQCPSGQVFYGSSCVPVAFAPGCGPSTPTVAPPSTCVGQPDGYSHALGSCSADYCVCKAGMPVFYQCPNGQVFYGSSCVPVASAPGCVANPTVVPPSSCVGQPDGYSHALGPCNQDYCVCKSGMPVFMQCPAGQVFYISACVPVASAPGCVSNPTVAPPSSCVGQPDGYSHALGSCNQDYCVCKSGMPVFMQCPAGQVFYISACVPVASAPGCVSNPTVAPPSSCVGQPDGYSHALGPCNQDYCVCKSGMPVFMQCPAGQVFYISACVPVASAPGCVSNPTVAPPSSCVGQPDGYSHALGPCNQDYCVCKSGMPVFMQCPAGYVFYASSCVPLASAPGCTPSTPETPTVSPPSSCVGQPDGYSHSLSPCNQDYCQCFKGMPLFYQCPPGQVFSDNFQKCVSPYVDGCLTTPPAEPSTTTTQSPNPCVNRPEGTIVMLGLCENHYLVCRWGKPVLTPCPDGQVFELEWNMCVPRMKNPACDNNNPTQPSPTQTTVTADFFVHPGTGTTPVFTDPPEAFDLNECSGRSDGALPGAECQSADYVFCAGGQVHALSCLSNQVFDGTKCVSRYACGSKPAPFVRPASPVVTPAPYPVDPTTVSNPVAPVNRNVPSVDARCAGGDGNFAADCGQMLLCSNGVAHIVHCPAGLAFNVDKAECDYASNVQGCEHLAANTNAAAVAPECTGGDGTYPTSECSKFVMCSGGVAHVTDCPAGLVFNAVNLVCDYASNVDGCDSDTPSDGSDGLCGTDGYYPADTCSQFIQCYGGSSFVHDCPAGLVFNDQIDVCDQPANVPRCPQGQDGVSGDSRCSGHEEGELFAHESDCHQFLRCVHGQVLEFQCPPTTVFNQAVGVCDHSDSIQC